MTNENYILISVKGKILWQIEKKSKIWNFSLDFFYKNTKVFAMIKKILHYVFKFLKLIAKFWTTWPKNLLSLPEKKV